MISISIISHGHGQMVTNVVMQLLEFPEVSEIFVVKNIPEELFLPHSKKIILIENSSQKGFGCNHNHVFYMIKNDYFCPLNPDIVFTLNPFPVLIDSISRFKADLVSPLVVSSNGSIEDSARNFPSFRNLINKFNGGSLSKYSSDLSEDISYPDWIAGMFMMFRSETFRQLEGFDKRYFLYYEDADICTRLWRHDYKLLVNSSVSIIHDARRSSHSSAKYAAWHFVSMVRYFITHWGRFPVKKI